MSAWNEIRRWAGEYGFVLAVFSAAIGAAIFGLSAASPKKLPQPALSSAALWRLELIAIAFVIFYVMLLAIVLARWGFGFVQVGPGGVKTGRVAQKKQAITLRRQEEVIEGVRGAVARSAAITKVGIGDLQREIADVKHELGELRRRGR